MKQVHDDFAARCDKRSREIFTKGDTAQVDALQEEVNRHGSDCKAPCRIEGKVHSHETDWEWIDKETLLHRKGECSSRNTDELP